MKCRIVLAALLVAPLVAQGETTQADPVLALTDSKTRERAKAELYRLGAKAVPDIAARLQRGWSDDKDNKALGAALDVLGQLGAVSEPALDPLLQLLFDTEDTGVREWIMAAIGRCAPYCGAERAEEVRKTLSKRMFGGDNFLFGPSAFTTLARLKFDASAELPDLAKGLEDDNPYVRELAGEAIALRFRGVNVRDEQRSKAVSALIDALAAKHPREYEIELNFPGGPLTSIGGSIDYDAAIHAAAARALAVLAPDEPESVPGHVRDLGHLDPMVQVSAARAIGALGEAAAAAVEPLAEMLSSDDLLAAREAATALGMVGAPAKGAIPALEKAAGSDDRQLAGRAKAALRQLQRD